MGANIEFRDFSIQVKAAMNEAAIAFLHEAGGEVVAQTVRNSRVDTGKTAGSFQNVVDVGKYEATIGSSEENAIWEEFGTGEYALHGDGRKGGWSYQDKKGQWHHTRGKTPSRAFWKGFNEARPKIVSQAEKIFGEKLR